MSIHPLAAAGFAQVADTYERGRPGYPDAAVDRLVAALPGRAVVDLGAGTGKLTRALVARGCDVVAIEPVAEMRAAITAPVRVRPGSAENTGLPAASADAVTIAQAFHWFNAPLALAEIHRILRPGGVLALIWNQRQRYDSLQDRLCALLEPHCRKGTPVPEGAWRTAFTATSLFESLHEETFANEQVVDAAGLADQIRSIGYVASLHESERSALLEEVCALAGDGVVVVRYVVELQITTRCNWCGP